MNTAKVDDSESNPEMLFAGLDTYYTFKRSPLTEKDKYLVDDGVEYNKERILDSHSIPDICSAQYYRKLFVPIAESKFQDRTFRYSL